MPHGVVTLQTVIVKPVEESTEIADIVVDGGNADRLSEVSAPLRVVCLFLLFIGVEAVFPPFLEVADIVPYGLLTHFLRGGDTCGFHGPTFKKTQGLVVACYGLSSQTAALAVVQILADVEIKVMFYRLLFHKKTLPIYWIFTTQ